MQKSSVQKCCSLLKPNIFQNRATNERNTKGSSITIYFYSRWRNLFKSKKCSKFRRRASLHDRVVKLILHAKAPESAEFLPAPTTFAVNFSAVALPVVPKVESTFEAIIYITIFVFWCPESRFKSVICIQNSLTWKRTDRHVFAAVERRKKKRKVWGLSTPWSSSLLRPTFFFGVLKFRHYFHRGSTIAFSDPAFPPIFSCQSRHPACFCLEIPIPSSFQRPFSVINLFN